MREVAITRLQSSDEGTFGRLVTDDLSLFTLELPWRNNHSNISCIPSGDYIGLWSYSPHFRRFLYLIYPVDGRAGIRMHTANLAGDIALGHRSQLNGCIALGLKLGILDGQKAVLLSRPAMRRFEDVLQRQTFALKIVNN